MGRLSYSSRQEADSLKQVSISFLKEHGYLDSSWMSGEIAWSRNGEKTGSVNIQSSIGVDEQYIKLIYARTDRDTGEKNDFNYKVSLATTPCHFGGKRYWFVCPCSVNGVYCGRGVGVLYLGGDYFACRYCYNLTYNSRNLSGVSKVAGQVISIPELEDLERKIKHKYYAGKMTKKYEMYRKKEEKSIWQLMITSRALYKHK